MESIYSWSQRAKCRESSVDFFFPEHGYRTDDQKKFCTGCPVITQCKTYAIAHDERGIWGGTNYKERLSYGKELINLIRSVFLEAGLLEVRPRITDRYVHSMRLQYMLKEQEIEQEIKLLEEQQLGHVYSNVHQEVC